MLPTFFVRSPKPILIRSTPLHSQTQTHNMHIHIIYRTSLCLTVSQFPPETNAATRFAFIQSKACELHTLSFRFSPLSHNKPSIKPKPPRMTKCANKAVRAGGGGEQGNMLGVTIAPLEWRHHRVMDNNNHNNRVLCMFRICETERLHDDCNLSKKVLCSLNVCDCGVVWDVSWK